MIKGLISIIFSLALITPAGAQTALPHNGQSGSRALSQARYGQSRFGQEEYGPLQNATSSREDFLKQANQIRQNFQNAVAAERAQIQNKIDTYKAKLKSRLSQIKDQKKANAVQNINDSLIKLNNVMVDHFVGVLNQLSAILDRIQVRTNNASSRGLNVAAVTADIASARTAIASATAAVKAQGTKIYEIAISASSTSTFKFDVKTARDALHNDLVKLNNQIKAARDAVHKAAVDLGQINGVDEDLKATSSEPARESGRPESISSATSSQE